VKRRRYLVAYDIADDRRLRDIGTCMRGYGERLQYSVFLSDLTPVELVQLRQDLRRLMNQHQDSVAIIDLGEAGAKAMERFEFIGMRRDLPDDEDPMVF
jgi:CRISPR-associated protein Cas2